MQKNQIFARQKQKIKRKKSALQKKKLPSVYDFCMFCKEKCFAGEGGEICPLCEKYVCQSCNKAVD